MTAPIRHRIELDAVGEFHSFDRRKLLELALRLSVGILWAAAWAPLRFVPNSEREVLELYIFSRRGPKTRNHMSSPMHIRCKCPGIGVDGDHQCGAACIAVGSQLVELSGL